jgi:UDP-glucose 6-dehydrogenase
LWGDLLAHKFAFRSKGFSVVIIQKAVGSVTKLSSSKCNLFQPHLEKSLEAIQGEKREESKGRKSCLEMKAINLL